MNNFLSPGTSCLAISFISSLEYNPGRWNFQAYMLLYLQSRVRWAFLTELNLKSRWNTSLQRCNGLHKRTLLSHDRRRLNLCLKKCSILKCRILWCDERSNSETDRLSWCSTKLASDKDAKLLIDDNVKQVGYCSCMHRHLRVGRILLSFCHECEMPSFRTLT